MTFNIRKATYDDITEIQNVAKVSWNETYEGIIPIDIQNKFLDESYSEDMLKKRIDKSILLVATNDNNIVGFVNLTYLLEGNKSMLMAIYILKAYQGKGIGSKLLSEAISYIDTNSKEVSFEVEVEKENNSAIQFYQSKNFVISEEYVDYFYDYPLQTVKMTMKL
ncbi:GNAT family N-acetyltransferase [Macrococcoides caseolyticum]|uniref:GNAT family N-acetyltransferase n=1 Tax=Macrococcoides caseolyticum TaxID=69966 RepID=UPI001F369DB0|nr:GNAT family N-acetyltransferase [Macrococcus caseolyticus]MCE4956957.1 GNAT family N-acetyltransferase [Macrococcus caseolyticus]